jgi:hypothetical protein
MKPTMIIGKESSACGLGKIVRRLFVWLQDKNGRVTATSNRQVLNVTLSIANLPCRLRECTKSCQLFLKIGNLQELPTKTRLQFSEYQKGNFELPEFLYDAFCTVAVCNT